MTRYIESKSAEGQHLHGLPESNRSYLAGTTEFFEADALHRIKISRGTASLHGIPESNRSYLAGTTEFFEAQKLAMIEEVL
jgi:hypothetical protein